MSAPFPADGIESILADACVGISSLKKNPAAVIAAAQEQQVAILNRNKPVAYLVSPDIWETLVDMVADAKLAALVQERLAGDEEPIRVSLDDL